MSMHSRHYEPKVIDTIIDDKSSVNTNFLPFHNVDNIDEIIDKSNMDVFNSGTNDVLKNGTQFECNDCELNTKNRKEKVGGINDDNRNDSVKNDLIIILASFFEKYWTENANQLSKGWPGELNKYFESVNKKCVLKFNYHKLKYGNQRNKKFTPFLADAQCKVENCCKYKFIIKEPLIKVSDYKLHIITTGTYNHASQDIQRRHITGNVWEQYAEQLQHTNPSVLAGELLAKNATDVLDNGNRNHAPFEMLLQKISSDGKKKWDLDPNFHLFFCKLKQKYDDDDELIGKHISGYIQGYSTYPAFTVTLFTEKQLLEMIKTSKDEFLFLYFDATGSIFQQPPDSDKRVFYYFMVLPKNDWHPPVAVLEFKSCGHSVRSIHSCLDIQVEALKKLSSEWPIVKLIETDFSKAMIQASCKAFNNMDLEMYINKTYLEITNPERDLQPRTIIHVCSSYLIKAAMKRIRTFTMDEEHQELLRSAVSLLIHATDFEHAKDLFRIFVILFELSAKTCQYDIYLQKLKDIKPLDLQKTSMSENAKNSLLDKEEKNEEIVDFQFSFANTKREQSEFYQEFYEIFVDVTENSKVTNEVNALKAPAFIKYLLNELLPYFPLWSAIVIKEFGIRRNSNACVESWNKIIKHFIFDGKMRQLIPRAISTLETNIRNRLRLREYDRRSTRQQENQIKSKMKALEECAKNSSDEIKNFEDENGDSSRFKDDIHYELSEIEKEMLDLGIPLENGKENKRKRIKKRTRSNKKRKEILNLKTSESSEYQSQRTQAPTETEKMNEQLVEVTKSSNKRKRVESVHATEKIQKILKNENQQENMYNNLQSEELVTKPSKVTLPEDIKNIHYDLYCEEWQRRTKSEIFNGGFNNFSRSVEEWISERETCHMESMHDKNIKELPKQQDNLNELINSGRSCKVENENTFLCPWNNIDVNNYPVDWTKKKNFIYVDC